MVRVHGPREVEVYADDYDIFANKVLTFFREVQETGPAGYNRTRKVPVRSFNEGEWVEVEMLFEGSEEP